MANDPRNGAAAVLDARPMPYFDAPDIVRAIANIKGTRRKQVATEHLLDGRLAMLDQRLLAESLDDDVRADWTGVHPSFFGGEALPDALPGEVEIARVVLQLGPDSRGEAISVRARPSDPSGIALRVVDEQGHTYALARGAAPGPLSLRELVDLLDTARRPDLGAEGVGLIDRFRAGRLSDGEPVDHILAFVQPMSVFYPALAALMADRADDWLAELPRHWHLTRRIDGIADPAPALAVLAGGRRLAVGSGAHLLLIDAEGDAPIVAVTAHDGALTALTLVARRELLVSGGTDGRVRAWHVDGTSATFMGDDGPSAPVTAVAAADTTSVVAAARDHGAGASGGVELWDLDTGDALGELGMAGATGSVETSGAAGASGRARPADASAGTSGESSAVGASGSFDASSAPGEPSASGIVGPFGEPAASAVVALAFLSDGERLVAADIDGLRVWDVPRAVSRAVLAWRATTVIAAPRGGWLAASDGAETRVVDAATGSVLRTRGMAAPDGPRVEGTSRSHDAHDAHDAHDTHDTHDTHDAHDAHDAHDTATSPAADVPSRGLLAAIVDGRTLAVAEADGIALWDLVAGHDVQRLDGLPGPPLALAAAPDAYALAASFADGTVWVWRLVVGAAGADLGADDASR